VHPFGVVWGGGRPFFSFLFARSGNLALFEKSILCDSPFWILNGPIHHFVCEFYEFTADAAPRPCSPGMFGAPNAAIAHQQAQQAASQPSQQPVPAVPQNVAQTGAGGAAPAAGGGQNLKFESALGFLDKVKTVFADQQDVYNRFLDIMKGFKTQTYVFIPNLDIFTHFQPDFLHGNRCGPFSDRFAGEDLLFTGARLSANYFPNFWKVIFPSFWYRILSLFQRNEFQPFFRRGTGSDPKPI
jgi:hypothetical protein